MIMLLSACLFSCVLPFWSYEMLKTTTGMEGAHLLYFFLSLQDFELVFTLWDRSRWGNWKYQIFLNCIQDISSEIHTQGSMNSRQLSALDSVSGIYKRIVSWFLFWSLKEISVLPQQPFIYGKKFQKPYK